MSEISEPVDRQSPHPLDPAESQYKGVRGWLLLFCIGLTVLTPLVSLGSISMEYGATSEYFGRFPGLMIITITDMILSLGIMAFSIYAGVALWTIRPGAVRTAKTYLWFFLGYTGVAAILPFTAGFPRSANDAMVAEVAKNSLRSIIYFVIWYTYLNKSKRVKATYLSKIAPDEKFNSPLPHRSR